MTVCGRTLPHYTRTRPPCFLSIGPVVRAADLPAARYFILTRTFLLLSSLSSSSFFFYLLDQKEIGLDNWATIASYTWKRSLLLIEVKKILILYLIYYNLLLLYIVVLRTRKDIRWLLLYFSSVNLNFLEEFFNRMYITRYYINGNMNKDFVMNFN